MFSERISLHAKQKKGAHIDFIKRNSSREKVGADQCKSFQQKHNVRCAQKPSQTNDDGDIRMRAGYVNRLHSIFPVML